MIDYTFYIWENGKCVVVELGSATMTGALAELRRMHGQSVRILSFDRAIRY